MEFIKDIYSDNALEIAKRNLSEWKKSGAFRSRHLAVKQRKFHIVYHIERVDEVEALKDESQGLVTECGQFLVAHVFGAGSVYFDGSRGRIVEQSHDVQ